MDKFEIARGIIAAVQELNDRLSLAYEAGLRVEFYGQEPMFPGDYRGRAFAVEVFDPEKRV